MQPSKAAVLSFFDSVYKFIFQAPLVTRGVADIAVVILSIPVQAAK
jgi:hypothetical protein